MPTHAGIVWTDVDAVSGGTLGIGSVIFEAYGPASESLGAIFGTLLGDGAINGGTSEDRFFGVKNPGGVTRITVTMPDSTDWEVDHLQYLRVPEPTTIALLGIGLGGLFAASRRRIAH